MKRTIRRSIDVVLTALGISVIFSTVLLGPSLGIQIQMPLAIVGVMLMEAGVWGLSTKMFPSGRRYSALRSEGDQVLALIRELNSAAIARDRGLEDAKRFQSVLEEMHNSVARMAELASMEDGVDASAAEESSEPNYE